MSFIAGNACFISGIDVKQQEVLMIGEIKMIIAVERKERSMNGGLISRQDAIDALWEALYEYEDKTKKQFQESDELDVEDWILHRVFVQNMSDIDRRTILDLPSAQPERYTKEELRVFQHGISLSLLSKRSAQHWQYDEDTATEIKFLERLYEKVGADMRGEQDE